MRPRASWAVRRLRTLPRMGDRWATFDCYGTLVDWPGGVRETMQRLWSEADGDALLAAYMRLEPGQEGRYSLPRGHGRDDGPGRRRARPHGARGRGARARRCRSSWRVFPEVPDALTELSDRGWKLAIPSNTDPDLLEASISSIGVEIDERVVASDIGSYKPAFGHWETFFRRTDAERTRHVHVAARRCSTTSSRARSWVCPRSGSTG